MGSSYPLWCTWPGADGEAPPGGEEDQGQCSAISNSPAAGNLAQGPQGRRVQGRISLVRTKHVPPSQPPPSTILRDSCFHLARRRCSWGTGIVLFLRVYQLAPGCRSHSLTQALALLSGPASQPTSLVPFHEPTNLF